MSATRILFQPHLKPSRNKILLIVKLSYAVLVAARKLRPYFDAHTIDPQKLSTREGSAKMDIAGRLLRWVIELSKCDLEFHPRTIIKVQALDDFVVEAAYQEEEMEIESWEIVLDGSAAHRGAGAGILMTSLAADKIEYVIIFKFAAFNNEAEYEAAITGVQMCLSADAKRVKMTTNSQLVANQLSGE